MAEAAREDQGSLSLDEAKETITAKGRERGFVTSEDLLESVPVEDFTPEQVEDFLTQIEEHLRGEGIDIIEVPAILFLGIWFLFQAWQGGFAVYHPQGGGGVAFFAHIGGFLFGLLTVRLVAIRKPLAPTW